MKTRPFPHPSLSVKSPRFSSTAHAAPPPVLTASVAVLVAFLVANTPAQALPEGGQVATGQASIATNQKAMTITASDRAILNFTKFNIAAEESVRFVQPSSASSVLARATDGTPSEIFGRLEANGRLVLANAAGIYFRNGSVVSVGGLLAAAANVADADFLRNDGRLALSLTGEVHNGGQLSALDGNIALLGRKVLNTGSIVAPSGAVVLFAGENILLSEPDGDIAVVRSVSETTDLSSTDVTNAVSSLVGRAAGASAQRTSGAGVEQAGKVSASSVFLGAADLYAVGVRHTGSTSATSRIQVKTPGPSIVSGEISATTQTAGAVPSIQIQAETVEVTDASIAASGTDSGGSVEIKGQEVAISLSSTINVSGSNSGNGGNLAIYAPGLLRLEGVLSARGGESGGNGGVISLNTNGPLAGTAQLIDLSAPAGQPGTLEQNAPSEPEVREGASGVGSFTLTTASDASAISLTDGDPTLPSGTGVPRGSTGGILVVNSNPGSVFVDLTNAGIVPLVPPTVQTNPGGGNSAVTLTGGGLILNSNVSNQLADLTLSGGNLGNSATGQPNSGTAPQNPSVFSPGTDQANLFRTTEGIFTLTTTPGNYTGHGTIILPGGGDRPTAIRPVSRGIISLSGATLSPLDQNAMAGALQVASPLGNSMLRVRAPQLLADSVLLNPVPSQFALGAGIPLPQGFSRIVSPMQQAGSPLSSPFATDAFSALLFSASSRTAPEKSSSENSTRE